MIDLLFVGNLNSIHIKRTTDSLGSCSFVQKIMGIQNEEIYPLKKCVSWDFNFLKFSSFVKESVNLINLQGVNWTYGALFSDFDIPIIASFWGTELFAPDSIEHRTLQRVILEKAKLITYGNQKAMDEIRKFYPSVDESKGRLIRHPMLSPSFAKDLTEKDEKKFHENSVIPEGSLIVSVGNNVSDIHQQEELIFLLETLSLSFLKKHKLIFLFHLYGGDKNRVNFLKKKLSQSKIRDFCRVNNQKLNEAEISMIRKKTDIFVHLPVIDMFAISILEYLYHETVLITGEWLSYQELHDSNVSFVSLKEIADFPAKFKEVVENIDEWRIKCKKNVDAPEIYYKDDWGPLYEEAFSL